MVCVDFIINIVRCTDGKSWSYCCLQLQVHLPAIFPRRKVKSFPDRGRRRSIRQLTRHNTRSSFGFLGVDSLFFLLLKLWTLSSFCRVCLLGFFLDLRYWFWVLKFGSWWWNLICWFQLLILIWVSEIWNIWGWSVEVNCLLEAKSPETGLYCFAWGASVQGCL